MSMANPCEDCKERSEDACEYCWYNTNSARKQADEDQLNKHHELEVMDHH